jgi:hypothetical protein
MGVSVEELLGMSTERELENYFPVGWKIKFDHGSWTVSVTGLTEDEVKYIGNVLCSWSAELYGKFGK